MRSGSTSSRPKPSKTETPFPHTLMTSTLTPPGELLNEQDALTLWNNRDRLRPDQLPRAKERLRSYRDARQAAGEPLWPSASLAQRRYEETVEGLFLDGVPVPGASNPDDADLIRDYSFLSLVTKQPGHVIAQSPTRLRKAVADYLGDSKAGDSPGGMKSLATQFLKRQRDIRYLVEGNGKNDEASKPLNDSSLFASAWNAAREGKATADGYAEWAAKSQARPEWKSAQGEDLFAKYSAAHDKAAAKWADYRARAEGIRSALESATSNDQPLLDASAALPFVSGLTREERQTVFSLLKGKEEKPGGSAGYSFPRLPNVAPPFGSVLPIETEPETPGKGVAGKSGEAVGRVFARLLEAEGDDVARLAALTSRFSAGQEVLAGQENDPAALVRENVMSIERAKAAGPEGGMAGAPDIFKQRVKLTQGQADAANAERDRMREAVSLRAELRDIARGTVDPVKGSNWWSDKFFYGSLNLAASVASFATRGGMALNWNAYVSEEQNRLESLGVTPQVAERQAIGVGSAQAALDQLSLHLLSKLPVLRSIKGALTAPAAGIAGTAARRIPGALGIAAGEALIEGTQDALPLLTQKTLAALKVDEPDVDWDQIGKEAWTSTETTFFAMLPLALIGLGVGTSRDYKNVRAIVTDRNALQQLGFSREATDYIASGENAEQSVQRLRESWGGRTPQVTVAASPGAQAADEVLQDPNASAAEVITAAQSKARYEEELSRGTAEVQELQRYAGVSEVRRTDAGWEVVREDGTVIPASSPDAAVAIMNGLGQAADKTEADALVGIADAWHDNNEGATTTTFTGTIARGTKEGITYSRPGSAEVVREVTDRATLANLYEEARMQGAEEINVLVNGSNRVFTERVADGAKRIVKALEINLGGQPQVVTLLHEQVEANLKNGLQSGAVTDSEMMSALNFAAMALPANAAPASNTAGRAFRERVMRGAIGELSTGEMRETIVELAVADTIGKRKDGGFMPAGAISRALTAAIHGNVSPEERSGLQKFRALLRAVKSYIRGVMGTVAGLRKARRDGKLADGNALDTLLEKITGRSQQEVHNKEALAESSPVPNSRAQPEAGAQVRDFGNGTVVGPSTFSITAYHGTPHRVDRFSTDKIGTGEGNQSYGWGLYFAEDREVAEYYREALSGEETVAGEPYDQKNPVHLASMSLVMHDGDEVDAVRGLLASAAEFRELGDPKFTEFADRFEAAAQRIKEGGVPSFETGTGSLYTVDIIPDRDAFLDWDAPFNAQPYQVQKAVRAAYTAAGLNIDDDLNLATGRLIQTDFLVALGSAKAASEHLAAHGIPGIRYLDGNSRRAGEGSRNFVVFREDDIRITDKNGEPFTLQEVPEQQKEYDPYAMSFSLSSVDSLEAVAAQIEARMARGGPEAKVEVLGNLARTLNGMARSARYNEEVERVLAAGQIESKRRALRKELLDQYTIDVLESPVGAALGSDLSLRDAAVTGRIIDPARKGLHGMLLAPSKARRQGRLLAGEYDDAAGLPGWMFHGERTPDQLATSLGMDVAEMYSAIHDELSAHAKMREYQKSARQQMAEARVRASREAAAWASKERAKLAQSDERDARRALIALDSMILQLPADVRKTVGGFAPLSELTTNKAREAYFLKAVDRIDRALETHLRKDFKTRIAGLFDRARARMNPGTGDRGKLGVNGHVWFQRAEETSKMGEQALAEREAFIESRLNGAQDLTDAEITELNRLWDFGGGQEGARMALEQEQALLELFGGMNHTDTNGQPVKSSGELEAAWKAARDTLAQNRAAWEAQLVDRRTWRVARKLQLQADSKNNGTPDIIKARKQALEGLGGDIQDFMQKGFTFEQLVGDIFGRESATHQYAERTALSAQIKEKRDWMNRQTEFAEFMQSLWPRTSQIGIQRNLEELQLPRKVPGAPAGLPEMSQLEAVHFTMLWADLDSRNWLAEWRLGDDAQAAMEAWLTPEAKEIRRWLQERYDAQYDEINEVYRRLYGVNMPRVLVYTPRIVEHGTTSTVSDPQNPGQAETRGVFAGFTKRRRPVINSQPIQMDALSAYWQNQRVTGHWRAWAEPMRELRALFSTNDSQPFIKAAAGEDAAVYVNQWLTDLENNGYREALAIRGLQKFLGVNAKNALFGKLGVLGKQMPAAYGAALEIGWSEYQRGVRRIVSGQAAITLEEMWKSEIMRQRRWADDPLASQAGRASGLNRFDRLLRKVGAEPYAIDMANEWLGGRIGWMDAFYTNLGAAAAYDFHYRQAIERGESDAEARAEAMARTEITIARTAQPDSLVTKSLYENRMGLWGRVMFAFQSANRQALFATFAAFRDGGMKSGRAWRMALTHWALTGFLTQTIGNIARTAFSDDDADEIWEVGDYLRAMILGPLTGALYLGPVVDLIGGLTGGFERRQAPGIAGAIGDGTRKAAELLTDPDAEFDLKAADAMIRALGYAIGGRAAAGNVGMNIWKQIDGLRKNVGLLTEKEATAKEIKTRNKREKAEKKAEEEARRAALTPEERQAEDDREEEEKKRRKEEKLEKQRERQGPV